MSDITYGIDWLSVTAKVKDDSVRLYSGVLPYLSDEPYEEIKPKLGYTIARRFTAVGVIEMSNPERPDMGIHSIYSGQALARMQSAGFNPVTILQWHVGKGHNVARIDVKLDCIDTGLDIAALASRADNGEIETQAKAITNVQSMGCSGHTLYIGSLKKRKKLLRIYDKAAELGTALDGVLSDHKRIELEVHGKPATSLAKELASSSNIGLQIAGAIKGYANFQSDEVWQEIFHCADAWKLGSQSAIKTDGRVDWLLKQCAPALAKELAVNPAFMALFTERVTYELEKIGAISSEIE